MNNEEDFDTKIRALSIKNYTALAMNLNEVVPEMTLNVFRFTSTGILETPAKVYYVDDESKPEAIITTTDFPPFLLSGRSFPGLHVSFLTINESTGNYIDLYKLTGGDLTFLPYASHGDAWVVHLLEAAPK